jgi:CRP-like cAMP-binding protein
VVEKALAGVEYFATLPKEELAAVARSLQLVEYKKGELVVTEGDPVGSSNMDGLYIVWAGKAAAEKGGAVVKRYRGGEHFGELALLSAARGFDDFSSRSASVRANGGHPDDKNTTHMLRLPADKFTSLSSVAPTLDWYTPLAVCLETLTPVLRKTLCGTRSSQDPRTWLRGCARCERRSAWTFEEAETPPPPPPEPEAAPEVSTVQTGDPLASVLPAGSGGWAVVEKALAGVEYFATLPKEELAAVARSLQLVEYKKGELIIADGDPVRSSDTDGLYIVWAGKAAAEKGGAVVKRYRGGQHFGELALLSAARGFSDDASRCEMPSVAAVLSLAPLPRSHAVACT